MINITGHRLHLDDTVISDLRERLERTRWPVQLPGVDGWSKGVPVDAARAWAERWAEFDWAARQQQLNAVPQFGADIDGHRLHFAHVRSDRDDAIGLLLLHGWPDTSFELFDLIEDLVRPETDQQAFHVVIPSHPGMGVPGPTSEPWDVDRTAKAYAALMSELGHDQYVVQGGDHGAVLAPHVARVDPDHVRGVHVNAATLGFMPMEAVDDETRANLTPIEQRRLDLITEFLTDGSGYNTIQTTRPQTIGYGLTDSPTALLTWFLEKYHDWAGDPAVLENPRVGDAVLTNLTIYWATGTATSAVANVYAAYGALFADPLRAFADSQIPTGVLVTPTDPSIRQWAEQSNTITHWTDAERGGHFAALETPDLLVADLREFVSRLM